MFAVDLERTFDMKMIESVAPLFHFFEVIAASVDTVRSIVLDTKLRQSAENNRPCIIFYYEVCPITVIYSNFNIALFSVFDKL